MLHVCNQRFDMTENFENFCELNKALYMYMQKYRQMHNCNNPNNSKQVMERIHVHHASDFIFKFRFFLVYAL